MPFNIEDWENIIHFGNLFASVGKKYFLALGTIPETGVSFIAKKSLILHPLFVLCHSTHSYFFSSMSILTDIDVIYDRVKERVARNKFTTSRRRVALYLLLSTCVSFLT